MTETVAYGAGGSLEALAVSNNVLTIWSLDARSWSRTQAIRVAIVYGSSS